MKKIEDEVKDALIHRAQSVHPSRDFPDMSPEQFQSKVRHGRVVVVAIAMSVWLASMALLLATFIPRGHNAPTTAASVGSDQALAAFTPIDEPVEAVAMTDGELWATTPGAGCSSTLRRLIPGANGGQESVSLPVFSSDLTSAADGQLWIEADGCGAHDGEPMVVKFDPVSSSYALITLPQTVHETFDIAAGSQGSVWLSAIDNTGSGELIELDPTGRVLANYSLPAEPRDIVVTDELVWAMTAQLGDDGQAPAIAVRVVDGTVVSSIADVTGLGTDSDGVWLLQDEGATSVLLHAADQNGTVIGRIPIDEAGLGFHGDHGTVGSLAVRGDEVFLWTLDKASKSRVVLEVDTRAGTSGIAVNLGSWATNASWPMDAAVDKQSGTVWVATLDGVWEVE